MSYEINKYAFLGCPLKDLVESISETDFPVIEDKMYLILDEKFEQIMAGLPHSMILPVNFSPLSRGRLIFSALKRFHR